MATFVRVYEVGPRDGLQNEAHVVSTGGKLALIRALAASGLSRIEATSFVSPRWIPQLSDAEEVTRALPVCPGLRYAVLVPNAKGLERLCQGLAARSDGPVPVDAAVFVSASETHNRKNVNKSIDDTFRAFEEVIGPARARGLEVRGYVSTVWGCPYEGRVDPAKAVAVAERLLAMGCYQVSLGDTIGVGTPGQTRDIVSRLLARVRPEQLAMHMHDTRGTALANVLVGLEAGIATFDAAIGGLGGCPYAPGASGNLATEDLVYMLHGMGYETGISWAQLISAGELAQQEVGRPLPGKALQAELGAKRRLPSPPSL